jgi:hypothetical protein
MEMCVFLNLVAIFSLLDHYGKLQQEENRKVSSVDFHFSFRAQCVGRD